MKIDQCQIKFREHSITPLQPMVNMSAKFDEDAQKSLVFIVFTRLFW